MVLDQHRLGSAPGDAETGGNPGFRLAVQAAQVHRLVLFANERVAVLGRTLGGTAPASWANAMWASACSYICAHGGIARQGGRKPPTS